MGAAFASAKEIVATAFSAFRGATGLSALFALGAFDAGWGCVAVVVSAPFGSGSTFAGRESIHHAIPALMAIRRGIHVYVENRPIVALHQAPLRLRLCAVPFQRQPTSLRHHARGGLLLVLHLVEVRPQGAGQGLLHRVQQVAAHCGLHRQHQRLCLLPWRVECQRF